MTRCVERLKVYNSNPTKIIFISCTNVSEGIYLIRVVGIIRVRRANETIKALFYLLVLSGISWYMELLNVNI